MVEAICKKRKDSLKGDGSKGKLIADGSKSYLVLKTLSCVLALAKSLKKKMKMKREKYTSVFLSIISECCQLFFIYSSDKGIELTFADVGLQYSK